jgi:hypothetical protein
VLLLAWCWSAYFLFIAIVTCDITWNMHFILENPIDSHLSQTHYRLGFSSSSSVVPCTQSAPSCSLRVLPSLPAVSHLFASPIFHLCFVVDCVSDGLIWSVGEIYGLHRQHLCLVEPDLGNHRQISHWFSAIFSYAIHVSYLFPLVDNIRGWSFNNHWFESNFAFFFAGKMKFSSNLNFLRSWWLNLLC